MFVVFGAVPVHGNLVPTQVTVQPAASPVPVQFWNLAAVISITDALTTSASNSDVAQDPPRGPGISTVTEKSLEVSCLVVPTWEKLAADAIEPIDAHITNTAPQSKPLLVNFFIRNSL
jgi:hypothetical protein